MRRFRNPDNHGRTPTLFGKIFTRRRAERQASTVVTNLTFELLEPRLQMAVVINEFLAANTNGLMDEDGARSDWVELYNNGASAVDLTGWHLTDDTADLDKWTLPATNLAAGSYLVVFASGKDRAVSGQELHTNFSLEQNGESLALVMPDGTTIADSFELFPEQLSNVSYGRGAGATTTDTLIFEGSSVRVSVPTAASGIDSTWFTTGFNDSSWTAGNAGIGFDSNSDGTDLNPFIDLNVSAQMLSLRPTAYIRIPFAVADPSILQTLKLRIRYEDGFGLYLNGTRITSAERAAPASLAWNSVATSSRSPQSAAAIYSDIDLTTFKHLLQAGNNVLAIHGLNSSAGSTDFLIDPLLQADRTLPPAVGYMLVPTPGAPNQQGTLGFVADTKFSVDRGFYNSSFNVEITTDTVGAEIRYTLDGSLPTATTGLVYNSLSPPLITQTTNLRAAAFKVGFTPSNVDTQTYVFLDNVIQQSGAGLPPVTNWGYAGPDWEMDPDVVNNPQFSSTIKDDLKAVPTVSLVMPWSDWFGPAGTGIYPTASELERAVSMEYFTADGSREFQIDAGIEIQGGTSDARWKMDKLSMRVKFKEPYGPEKLDADIFHGGDRDEGVATSFNTFILDAHLGYTWAYGGNVNAVDQRSRAMFVQDGYVSDLQNLAGGTAPHTQWVHLYINGLYWGMYEMHERADEHFAQSYLGGNDEDYDVIKHNPTNVVSADIANPNSAIDNYAAMLALVRADMTVPANYEAAAAKIDVGDFINYMIVNYFVGNDDWAHQNWYASYNRVEPNGKWRYHSWDAENVLKSVTRDSTTLNNSGGPTEVFQRLVVNPEFRLRFVDGVQRLMRNPGGLMTPTEAAAVYQARMQEIDRAIVGESARWGDNHTTASDPPGAGNPYIRDHWVARQNDLLANYFPTRTNIVLGQFGTRGWTVPLAAPEFSQYGGTVNTLSQVSLSLPGGTPGGAQIYYTLDGSDPRDRATNLPSASAILYNGSPITFADGLGKHVQARIYLDDVPTSTVNEWSPLVDATFLQETPFPVRITEINYHPAVSEDHEFFELTNTGSSTVNLAGVQITQFATEPVVFGNVDLAAGERIIVAKDPAAFQAQYGTGHNVLPTGYLGNLSNGSEQIVLLGPIGETLQSFTYSDSAPWPAAADGNGPSLEIINPLGDPSDPANWRASLYVNGSPGASGVPGDYDGNGAVQDADHGVWRSKFGMTVAVGTSGDGNRDGIVDLADYIIWRKAMTPPASAAAVVAVVENGSEPVLVSSGSPVSAPTESISPSHPILLAVDNAFSRFGSARPAYRPIAARTLSGDVGDDDLLLTSLASHVALGDASDADIAVDGSRGAESSIDQLLVEWSGVADSFN